jgi:putative transposase
VTALKTFKFRLYPSKAQVCLFEQTLDACCELYNAALQERRDAWTVSHKSIDRYSQSAQIPEIKADRPELKNIYSTVFREPLQRVDKAFQAFFRRVKGGDKPGYPRFRSRRRYNSFTYPQAQGFAIEQGKLNLVKIGKVKIKLHRPVEGKIKTLSIKREAGRWFACFAVEFEPVALPMSVETIGIDVGLTTFATLSDGVEIENPRYYKEAQRRLRKAQRKVARRKRGSHRRRKAVQLLQRVHAYIRNQRSDHHHKESAKIVGRYGLIAVEDLNVKGLAAGMLAKSIHDAGWSSFITKLAYKAECAGRLLLKVNPRGTSQTCLCGASTPKTLSQRWHHCPSCGLSAPRDHVSAQLILARGLRVQSATCTAG